MTKSWRQEKNASAFFESQKTAVAEGKSRLEKNSSEFFDLKEGVTLLTAVEYKQMIRKIGFQQAKKRE